MDYVPANVYHHDMQMTLSEAAVRLKMSERTVRRWLHSGKLQGSQLPTDRGFQWLVDIPDDLLEPPEEPSGELETLRELINGSA